MTLSYQQGGTLPFGEYLPYTGIGTGQLGTIPAVTDKSLDSKLKQEDLFKLIKELKGLPSDTNTLLESLLDIYEDANLFNNGELDSSALTSTYLSALLKMRYAEYNEKQFDQALKNVTLNGGLHEYAIDEYGRIMTQNTKTGKIKPMHLKDFYALKDDGVWAPLTNSNLLYYRAEDPKMAFKNDVLTTVSNGIGLEKVTEILQKALSGIGSDTISEDGYTVRQKNNITKGINILAGLVQEGNSASDIWGNNGLLSLDGVYATNTLTSDLKDQIKQAATYMWKAMPKNARTWLAIKSGNIDDPDKGALEMMLTLMLSHNTHKFQFKADILKDLNPDGSKKSSGGGSDDDKVNHYISILNKIHGSYGTFELNSGTNNSLIVEGTKYGSLPDFQGKPVGSGSMANLFTQGLSGIVEDMHGISFGDHVVSPEDLNNIWYDGSGGMMVDLPCKVVNGAKVVDLKILDTYNKAYEEFKSLSKENQTDANFGNILEQYGLYQLLDSDGMPNKLLFGLFLVVTGYGVDKNLTLWQDNYGDKNRYLEEVDTDNEDLMKLISRDLSTDSKKSNYEIDTENWFESSDPEGFFSYDHVYKGTLYIPISNNEGQGHNAAGLKLGYDVMHEDEHRYQTEQKRRSMRTIGSDILYQ